jgi:squalene-hopene/tetraprenyl-beta-curcumene cyclase
MNYTEEQVDTMNVGRAIEGARAVLLGEQRKDRYNDSKSFWQYPLEADCSVSAEYILLHHFIGDITSPHRYGIVNYILSKQCMDGGWSLYDGGPSDLSCSVKCYFALKAEQVDINSEPMKRAKSFILGEGGAEKANVFTRIHLALFKQVPWESIPWTPMEIILLPKWSPFHIDKVAYWTRCVMLPLTILVSNKAEAENPKKINVGELFRKNPWTNIEYFNDVKGIRPKIILKVEKLCRRFFGQKSNNNAAKKISKWIEEHSNNTEGLGGIFPAMAGVIMSANYLSAIDYDKEKIIDTTMKAIQNLVVTDGQLKFVQACISPVWDTAIAIMALKETQDIHYDQLTNITINQSARWLVSKHISITGDWENSANVNLNLPYNGWAFQNRNDYYPDVDDTAMVLLALNDLSNTEHNIHCGTTWLTTLQSKNGGYGAFDTNNDWNWTNDIPFADHKCMIDPPTADVSGRVLAVTHTENNTKYFSKQKLIKFLLKEQNNGFWYGRWGTNYLWGTWSAVMGLVKTPDSRELENALRMTSIRLCDVINRDGGFGEDNVSYDRGEYVMAPSNAFHTSLALLIMCDLYQNNFNTSQRLYSTAKSTADWLVNHQNSDGTWETHGHNAPGFPKVFMLKYYGYATYFPLWALARYEKNFR